MVKKQSLVFVKPGVMRLDEYEKDDEPSETEVLIDVAACGICGTDLHWHLVGKVGPATIGDNSIMGHEASGTIIKVGSKVTHLKPGDRVSCEPCVPCWTCDLCRVGSNNLCSHAEVYRCGMGRTGFFRSTNVWPANLCHKLPDNVSLHEGALTEPISCCVWAVRRAKLEGNENILITGAGPIGIICLMIAKAFGAGKICVTDVNEKRLAIAKSLGADYTIKTDSNATAEQIATEVREKMSCAPTITIECSGVGTCINTGILVCPKGGKVVLVGLSSRPVTVDLSTACVRQVDLITVSRYNNTFPTAIDLIASGKINAKALISHLIDLDDYQKAFDALKNGEGVKILLIPKKN